MACTVLLALPLITGAVVARRLRRGADRNAEHSLTDATACLRTAGAELAAARTPARYAQVTRTAVAGLRHVRAARAARLGPARPGSAGAAGGRAQVSYEPSQGGPKPRRSG
jgi:hypothetical protein